MLQEYHIIFLGVILTAHCLLFPVGKTRLCREELYGANALFNDENKNQNNKNNRFRNGIPAEGSFDCVSELESSNNNVSS